MTEYLPMSRRGNERSRGSCEGGKGGIKLLEGSRGGRHRILGTRSTQSIQRYESALSTLIVVD